MNDSEPKVIKKVYIGMAIDVLHPGHINIIEQAKKLGKVIVGLLTDEAIAQYKRTPILDFNQRKMILDNIKGVDEIIMQDSYDYTKNLRIIKPDYVVHGDDWKKGVLKDSRLKVIKVLKEWGGQLIEPKYTEGISASMLNDRLNEKGVTPNVRMNALLKVLKLKPLIKVMEAHNGLTGLIVEKTKILQDNGKTDQFDAIWLSSLTVSTSMGKPDTEVVEFSTRFQTIEEIMEVTTKPIIVDADSGGSIEHFQFRVRTLERLGVSAVIIEDKIGNKRNSLFGTDVYQEQDTINNFSEKINSGKKSQVTNEFMIIARIESLILKNGMEDALKRAQAYIRAGADGIMIHSKEKDGLEIEQFCKKYKLLSERVPLVVVPSTFSHMTEDNLEKLGVNIVIYGNHLIRSAYPAMVKVAKSILEKKRALEASEKYCMSIKDILTLIPEDY